MGAVEKDRRVVWAERDREAVRIAVRNMRGEITCGLCEVRRGMCEL